MNLLNPKKIRIEKKADGSITLTREDGKAFKNVHFLLLFPFTDLENFISAIVKKGTDQEQIGIISRLKDLPSSAEQVVREDLNKRYFIPEIKSIDRILDKYWFFEVHAVTDRGRKKFFLGSTRESIRFKADSSMVLTDMEKCRYKITRFEKMPAKSRAELERILM